MLQERRGWVITAAALLPLLVCAVLAGFRESVTAATDVLVLVVVVVAASATGDRVAGIVAALSSALWFDFFLTKPYNSVSITSGDDIEATVLLLVIGLIVNEVALWGRREQAAASERSGYLDGVFGTAEVVAAGRESPEQLVAAVSRQMTALLDLDDCRFVRGPIEDPRFAVLDHKGVVTRSGRVVEVEREGLPTNEETALPVRAGSETLGYFLLTSASEQARPSMEQRRVAIILADQMAAVLGSA